MNKYNIYTYPDIGMDIISLLINNDVIPSNVFSTPFFNTAEQANLAFSARVKSRKLSTFLDYLIDYYWNERDSSLTGQGELYLMAHISDKFKDKWNKLFELWNREYDPLQPFDITLSETYRDSRTSSDAGSESSTDDLTVNKDDTDDTSETGLYGFNSEGTSVPSDTSKSSSKSNYSSSNPSSKTYDKNSNSSTNGGRDYTRKGNIGNITKQQLIEEERRILSYQIIDTIFNDIASVICRGKYI